ncbi:MAG: NFACT RNA binding domain-containing protein [archaeon]
MKVELDSRRTAIANAQEYFAKSKRARKKLEGLRKAMEKLKAKSLEAKPVEAKPIEKRRRREWYEKFNWFFSSEGFLCIGGRDRQSNEAAVKRQMSEGDLYFHADVAGSAHCVLKTSANSAPERTFAECAEFAAVHSKAWNEKLSSADVYSVLPNQVSKSAPAGESLGSGAFMIYGERKWFKKTPLNYAIGVSEKRGMPELQSGPLSAVKANCTALVEIVQGKKSRGSAAKIVREILRRKTGKDFGLDEIIALLPGNECDAKK